MICNLKKTSHLCFIVTSTISVVSGHCHQVVSSIRQHCEDPRFAQGFVNGSNVLSVDRSRRPADSFNVRAKLDSIDRLSQLDCILRIIDVHDYR